MGRSAARAARLVRPALLLVLALPSTATSSEEGAPAAAKNDPERGALRVVIETIVVDRRGTRSAGVDEAAIFPGNTGVLERSLEMIGRRGRRPAHETVRLVTRVTPTREPLGACALRLDIETHGEPETGAAARPGGGISRKSVSFTLEAGEERLVEAYASPITEGRLALKLACEVASRPILDLEPRVVDIKLALERIEEKEGPELLRENQVRASLGRESTFNYAFNVPLENGEERYRRDRLEVQLTPLLVSAGLLQMELRLRADLATVSRAGPLPGHPVERSATLVLAPGTPQAVEVDVRSAGPQEGWTRVRFRLEVTSRF